MASYVAELAAIKERLVAIDSRLGKIEGHLAQMNGEVGELSRWRARIEGAQEGGGQGRVVMTTKQLLLFIAVGALLAVGANGANIALLVEKWFK